MSTADGARQGAPAAPPAADRWHLLKNLVEALEATAGQEERALLAVGRFPVGIEAAAATGKGLGLVVESRSGRSTIGEGMAIGPPEDVRREV